MNSIDKFQLFRGVKVTSFQIYYHFVIQNWETWLEPEHSWSEWHSSKKYQDMLKSSNE